MGWGSPVGPRGATDQASVRAVFDFAGRAKIAAPRGEATTSPLPQHRPADDVLETRPPMPPPDSPLRPAVFLDRDGTLNLPVVVHGLPEPPRSVSAFQLFPDVAAGCRALADAGFVLVVVTNQPDVGRGTLAAEVVEAQHSLLQQWIPELSRIEVCYDSGRDPTVPTPRRKPEPGMLFDAAQALGIDLKRSWMIGDRWRDVDCGHRAGVRTVFIDLGHAESLRSAPEFTVPSFAMAVAVVLREAQSATRPARVPH